MMASQYNDRVLWLCLGVSLFFAARGISAELRNIRKLAEITKLEKEEPIIGQATEDALKLDTLMKLSESSNFELRAAALRIISERSTRGPTRNLFLEDLSSQNIDRRSKALNALHFLVVNPTLGRSAVSARLRDISTFNALVDSLCHFLAEHTEQTSSAISPIRPRTRPGGENKALKTLNVILSKNIPAALDAGLVSRWLSNYPFPCAMQNQTKKHTVVFMTKTWWSDDPVMSSIINTLTSHQEGLKQLRKHGLMGSRMEEHTADLYDCGLHEQDGWADRDSDSDIWTTEEGLAPQQAASWLSSRPQENTTEEQALRRRRREAMVFSEGDHPLGQNNIIHPVNRPGLREEGQGNAERTQSSVAESIQSEFNHASWRFWPF